MNKKLLIFVSLVLLVSSLMAINPVAKTIKTTGDVELSRNRNIYTISSGVELFNDDEVICKDESYAAIKFSDDSSVVKLFPQSVLVIRSEKNGKKYDKKNILKMGELWTKVNKNSGSFEIETPTTVASVKGTGFLLSVDENGVTDLFTLEGEVEFTNKFDGIKTSITAGNRGTSNGQGQIIVEPYDISDLPVDVADFITEEIEETIPEVPRPQGGSSSAPRPSSNSAEIPEMEYTDETEVDDNSSSSLGSPISMGGGIGTVSEGENFYTQIRLLPELRFGKFGLGLDLELMIDSEGNIRESDWDDWKDYINKLYYLRYGHRGDKLYGQIGAIPSYTLGQGLIMKDYTNMLHYPNTKQIGLQLGGQIPIMEMQAEIFTSNITKNEILAGHVSIAPLTDSQAPILSNLRVGASLAHDTDQVKGLIDTDNDNYADVFDDYLDDPDWHNEADYNMDYYREIYKEIVTEENFTEADFLDWFDNTSHLHKNPSFDDLSDSLGKRDVTILGLDYELPLINSKVFGLGHYAEIAKFTDSDSDKGAGIIFPGFYSKFLIFQTNLEYRRYQDEFIPGFFDKLYDDQRATAYRTEIDTVVTKYDRLSDFKASQGWYGSITSNLFKILYLTIAYEDMYSDDDSNKSIWGNVSLDKNLIPKLNRAEINYMQKDFDKLSKIQLKGENAHIEGVVGYGLSSNTELVLNYRVQYFDLDNSGKIDGKDETITSMSMGVEFRF